MESKCFCFNKERTGPEHKCEKHDLQIGTEWAMDEMRDIKERPLCLLLSL